MSSFYPSRSACSLYIYNQVKAHQRGPETSDLLEMELIVSCKICKGSRVSASQSLQRRVVLRARRPSPFAVHPIANDVHFHALTSGNASDEPPSMPFCLRLPRSGLERLALPMVSVLNGYGCESMMILKLEIATINTESKAILRMIQSI